MADTVFTNGVTVTDADWFNDLNRLHYSIFNDPSNLTAVVNLILPAGITVPYSGTAAPSGWLECDGSAVSRTTYSRLFTAIGTTWGEGDTSTTFNLPDFRGRTAIGAGTGTTVEVSTSSSGNGWVVASNANKWITGMPVVLSDLSGFTTSASAGPTYYVVRVSSTNVRLATTLALAQNGTPDITVSGTGSVTITHTYVARTVGEVGGEEAHAMSSVEMLLHTHVQNAHAHGISVGETAAGSGPRVRGETGAQTGTVNSNNATATNQNTGGNAAAPNMQPFGCTMYIIKV